MKARSAIIAVLRRRPASAVAKRSVGLFWEYPRLGEVVQFCHSVGMVNSPSKRSSSRSLANLEPDEVKSTVDGIHRNIRRRANKAGERNTVRLGKSLLRPCDRLHTSSAGGNSFHFAPRRRGESFKASLLRHQHFRRRPAVPEAGDAGARCGMAGSAGPIGEPGAPFRGQLRRHQQQRLPDRAGETPHPGCGIALPLHPWRLHADSRG